MTPSIAQLLDVATDAAWLGGRRALAHLGTGLAVRAKADQSPVTQADLEAEHAIRARIERDFPHHSILGEELGQSQRSDQVRWIVDPIDGTKSFVCGAPLFGCMVAVEVEEEVVVGAVCFPATGELLYAGRGLGAHLNGRRCHVSSTLSLGQAALMTSDVGHLGDRGVWPSLRQMTRLQRTWGDCYGYMLVATGRADIMVDAAMNPWDCAALLPILEEAGGRFTTWAGERTIWGPDSMATNGALHDPMLALLAGAPPLGG